MNLIEEEDEEGDEEGGGFEERLIGSPSPPLGAAARPVRAPGLHGFPRL